MTTADAKKRKLLTVDDIKPSLRGILSHARSFLPRFVALSFFLSLVISFAAWEIESIVGIESARSFVFPARKEHHLTRFLSLIQQQVNGYPSCGQKLASGTTRKCSQ